MENKVILDLCGGTGMWSLPYKENGYSVKVLTLPDFDVVKWKEYKWLSKLIYNNEIYGILAAPPCTMFSIARNDKTAKKPRNLREGMKVVLSCMAIIHECLYNSFRKSDKGLKFWALENPYSGYLKKFLGEPYLVFQPYEYGDPYSKKTAIWGIFNKPKKNPVEKRDFEHPTTKGTRDFVSCVEHFADLKKIPDGYCKKTGYTKRQTLRSMTPLGFANCFYKANK
jgi:hypothetical protein